MAATDKAYHLERNGANFYLKSPYTIHRMYPYRESNSSTHQQATHKNRGLPLDFINLWLGHACVVKYYSPTIADGKTFVLVFCVLWITV